MGKIKQYLFYYCMFLYFSYSTDCRKLGKYKEKEKNNFITLVITTKF